MGLDGVGGYFSPEQPEGIESSVTITLKLQDDDGNTFDYPIESFQKTGTTNADLFHELSFDISTLPDIDEVSGVADMVIVGAEFGTDGAGNWELRYLETGVDDSFKYKAVDSDGGESEESVVTINDQRDNEAPDAVDDPVGYHLIQGDMGMATKVGMTLNLMPSTLSLRSPLYLMAEVWGLKQRMFQVVVRMLKFNLTERKGLLKS
ncbi:hypothetical protein JCM19240_322 [Vibrio maritimus]|uniref:T1SS secreted agglutinin RTX n=1 Tax=Vibrio maritimus TaxID=990268 RepID=A0A090T689_9VIBR|nr:hypothetical protein JCM19240_322 [Vibrio maritimus]